jgi:hypothetical protein
MACDDAEQSRHQSILSPPSVASQLQTAGQYQSGCLPEPIPFGGVGKPVNQNRISDHFPITIRVTEVD